MDDDFNFKEDEEQKFEKYKKTITVKYAIACIIIALIVAVFSSEFTAIYYKKIDIEKYEASENSSENIDRIAKNLKEFRKVIDDNFIGEIDEKKVLDETIKGYVKGLDDEYTEYMTAEEWDEFQTSALGNYVGIGIYMSVDQNNNVVVLSTIDGTPAQEAGLQPGDVIVSVDDENALGVSSDKVSAMIKGNEGTKVNLKVYRNEEYMDFEVERKAIKVYHVEDKMLENNIGYISLYTFDEGCAEEFKKAYEELKSQGAQKIILDLRNNTGGLVDECLDIADMIIDKNKKLLITVDSKDNKEISTSKNDPIVDCKMVVLVNEYSASASEILVGALKDNEKAKIVGKKTYGKGVIQSVIQLNDGSALKITINEYFTPNESKINKIGIEPDYSVELDNNVEGDEQLNKAIEVINSES